MRLFIALSPPPAAVAHLDRAVAALRPGLPELRWVPADRWHLTLAFLGEVADREVARVERRIGRGVAGRSPLDLRFAGAGRFGGQVLWVGVRGDRAPLRDLAGRVAHQDRPYRPHLTIARARESRTPEGRRLRGHADLRAAVAALEPYDGPVWRAVGVHLVRSYLGSSPRYEDVSVWPLGDGA